MIAGVKEFNAALGLSPSWYVAALEFVRDNHGLSGDAGGEAKHLSQLCHQCIELRLQRGEG